MLADDTALLTLSHTVFKSGYTYDMVATTRLAHDAGALVLWDLSHSAGSVPIDLNAAGADLAVGCTYKYLNGGPGAPAFLYIRRDLQETLVNPIAGWMSQANLFDFGLEHKPVAGLRRFLSGTPPVLSLALIEVGVDLLLSAGMDALRAKSVQQTEYLIALWEAMLQPLGYTLNSPRDPARRGSHISLGHCEGLRIDLALIRDLQRPARLSLPRQHPHRHCPALQHLCRRPRRRHAPGRGSRAGGIREVSHREAGSNVTGHAIILK